MLFGLSLLYFCRKFSNLEPYHEKSVVSGYRPPLYNYQKILLNSYFYCDFIFCVFCFFFYANKRVHKMPNEIVDVA